MRVGLREGWVLPAQDGTVHADADDVLIFGADAQTLDGAAVADAHIGHGTLAVQPDLIYRKRCRKTV